MNKGICFNYKYNSDYKERITRIINSGFDCVFIYSQYTPIEYIDLISRSSLKIEALHLPYKKFIKGNLVDPRHVNVLWKTDEESSSYVKDLIEEVKFANRYGIGTVVMHITGGDDPPKLNESGLINISKILDTCEKYNITLCLENLRRLDYLDYVFKHLDSDKLKFCFDSGHANSMTKNISNFPWDEFGKKLACLHLNDNNGDKDQHLIPFGGNINWDALMKVISFYNRSITLTLEVRSNNEIQNQYNEIEYLKLCFDSLNKLQHIMEEI